MNTKIIWSVIGVVVLAAVVVSGVYYFLGMRAVDETIIPANNIGTSTADMIRVDVPLANVLIQSPLAVRGEARGNWYFEASFPVKVFDANGKLLGQVPAQAQGDWMTTDFVPFAANVSFATSTTETGTVVFQKDNPSGLPANDASVSVPVYFSSNASKL
jgi:hypothetical protein